jgi:hypothetical protein
VKFGKKMEDFELEMGEKWAKLEEIGYFELEMVEKWTILI